jgi:hypothetical protein
MISGEDESLARRKREREKTTHTEDSEERFPGDGINGRCKTI